MEKYDRSKKKNERQPRMEELMPDEAKSKEVLSRLYKGDPILGDGGSITPIFHHSTTRAFNPFVPQGLNPCHYLNTLTL